MSGSNANPQHTGDVAALGTAEPAAAQLRAPPLPGRRRVAVRGESDEHLYCNGVAPARSNFCDGSRQFATNRQDRLGGLAGCHRGGWQQPGEHRHARIPPPVHQSCLQPGPGTAARRLHRPWRQRAAAPSPRGRSARGTHSQRHCEPSRIGCERGNVIEFMDTLSNLQFVKNIK